MESAQKELISVLLEQIFALGLISKTTCLNAKDLVHSAMELPELFRYPVCLTKEVSSVECAQDTQ